ncbi:MAG: LPS export ABC transporter periplasmic protein LptC [Spirochaetes bacterium]|nr:LPS export ABC transporter periplasmic protein LptC [Spirochaetota bacterium]
MGKSHETILIVWLGVILFFQCSGKNEHLNVEQIDASTNFAGLGIPDTEIFDFSYKYTSMDKVVWELFSEKGEVYNKHDLIKITGVNLNFYKGNRVDTTVVSKWGEIYKEKKLLTAISNVILTTEDRTVLYTEILHWDDNKKLLFTDQFVKIIKQNGDIIKGIGMEADHNLEKLVIKRSVTGQFHESK